MLRGYLQRDFDVSGNSGTGKVAEACKATDGRVTIFWPPGPKESVANFPSEQHALNAHGHGGKTYFVWLDDPVEAAHCVTCHSDNELDNCFHEVCPGCIASTN